MIGEQFNFLLVASILLLFFRKYVLKGFQNKLSKQRINIISTNNSKVERSRRDP